MFVGEKKAKSLIQHKIALVHFLTESKNIFNHSYSDIARFLLCPSAETWNVGVGATQNPSHCLTTSAWAHQESLKAGTNLHLSFRKRACQSTLNVFVKLFRMKQFPFRTKGACLVGNGQRP